MKFTNIEKLRTLVRAEDDSISSVSAVVKSRTDDHAVVELTIMPDCLFKLSVDPAEKLNDLKAGTTVVFNVTDGEITETTYVPEAKAAEKPKSSKRRSGSGCYAPSHMPKFSDL